METAILFTIVLNVLRKMKLKVIKPNNLVEKYINAKQYTLTIGGT